MNAPMPRMLWMTILFLAGLFALDRGLTVVLDRVFFGLETGAVAGLANYSIGRTNARIVAFGSSRAVFHIDPAVLEERLHRTAFNAGSPGQDVRYALAIESLLLRRGSAAELFVLLVDEKDLWGTDPARLARLAPFYGQDPVVDALLESTGPGARWKLRLGAYRYNSLVFPMLANWLRSRPGVGNGFRVMPADREQDLTLRSPVRKELPGPIDADVSRAHEDFMEIARQNDVEVVLLAGPRWRPDGLSEMERVGRARLAELCERHGARWIVIDEISHPVFQDPALFADPAHMTYEGAQILSGLLADRLAPILAGSSPPRDPGT